MTEKDIATIIRLLKAYYPYYYKNVTAEEAKSIIDVWKYQFGEIDYTLVERAVHKWGGTNTNPPTIPDLKHILFTFYHELDQAYSKACKDGNTAEMTRIGKQRELIWNCGTKAKK